MSNQIIDHPSKLFHLLLLDHVGLAEDLHGINMTSVNLLHESNLPKRSLPNNLDCFKVVNAQSTSFQSGKIKSSSGAKLKIAGQDLRWSSHKIHPLQIL